MSLSGIDHYRANMYKRSGSSTSSHLASLLGRSSVNSKMLKKAYSKLSQKTGKTYLNRTDTSENAVSKYYQSGSLSETENASALRKNASEMSLAAASLMKSEKLSDDALVSKVKDFAESYNGAVKALAGTSSYAAKLTGESMTGITDSFEASLSKAGITVNEDKTLSVDENVLKENRSQLSSLFKSGYSFGAKMIKKGSELQCSAQLTGLSAAGIYNRYGSFLNSSNE